MKFKEKAATAFQKFKTDLNLTEQQSNQIQDWLKNYYEMGATAVKETKGDKEARKLKIKPMKKELRQKIAGILDANQVATYKQHKGEYGAIFKPKAAAAEANQ